MRTRFRTHNTKRTVNNAIRHYEAFTQTPLESLTIEEATAFYDHLVAQKLAHTSIQTILRCLALLTANKILYKLRPYMPRKILPKKPAALLDFALVPRLIDTPDDPRDRAILALLFGTGARATEVVNLLTADVTPSKVTFRNTKTAPLHEIPLPEFIRPYLRAYKPHAPETRFFEADVDYQYVYRLVVKTTKAHGCKASPHAARATLATKMLTDKIPVEQVAACLGHSSISTTLRYDRRTKTSLAKQALAQFSYT